ncbi:MAG: protein translocase SEC61 complex subunit gamma [Nitrosopumilus sp.]
MHLNPKQTVRNMINTLKITKKPDRDEYSQHLRLVMFGIVGVGTIGFIIQFVFSVITFGR